jgi:hypothetical protein
VGIAPSARFPYTCIHAGRISGDGAPCRPWNVSFTAAHGDPAPADEDTWQLVFDQNAKRLFVRHEWHAARHAGTDEFTLDEFLIQRGAAPEALLALLFDRVTADP